MASLGYGHISMASLEQSGRDIDGISMASLQESAKGKDYGEGEVEFVDKDYCTSSSSSDDENYKKKGPSAGALVKSVPITEEHSGVIIEPTIPSNKASQIGVIEEEDEEEEKNARDSIKRASEIRENNKDHNPYTELIYA